jgi:hypothetical protein
MFWWFRFGCINSRLPIPIWLAKVSRRRIGGDDVDSLNFEKPEDVGSWLADRPAEWAQVVAVRAALRVFPIVLDALLYSKQDATEVNTVDLVLQAFRAGFVSWSACKYPMHATKFPVRAAARAADAAAQVAKSAEVGPAVVATEANAEAAYVVDSYSGEGYITRDSITSILAAIRSSTEAILDIVDDDDIANNIILGSISTDCQKLLNHSEKDELINLPLWSSDFFSSYNDEISISHWIRQSIVEFNNSKWGSSVGGRIISEWYRGLLPFGGNKVSSAFGRESDIAVATQLDEFWKLAQNRDVEKIWSDIDVLIHGGLLDPAAKTQIENSKIQIERDDIKGGFGSASFGKGPFAGSDEKKLSSENLSVTVQFDQFARKDELGRKRFAEVLATRISELHAGGGPDGLAVNLHAPWGAGKTTVLHFMKSFLEDETLPPEKRWVVVEFNAWQHEHRRPPWWPFLKTVKSQVSDRLIAQKKRQRAAEVRQKWRAWLFKAEAGPYLVVLFVVALLMALLWSGSSDVVKNIFGGIGSILAVLATLTLYSRKAFFGSEKSANLFHDYASDPLEKLSVLFKEMVAAADAPVCIFIDDLDRCQNEFVVELLEGLQTSFRHRKVAYVVAADKFWIKTSFEDKYPSFCEKTADRTQPLGYQFLEKIFQFNVPLPGMASWKQRYLEARLGLTGEGTARQVQQSAKMEGVTDEILEGAGLSDVIDPSVADAAAEQREDREIERLRGAIREQQPEGLTHEAVRTLSEGVGKDNTAYQAALALEYTFSRVARQEAKHFLLQYLELLPDNPRVIKRIINAFGMAVATTILEQQVLDYDVLTRWTILEQCYPAVADELARDPDLADVLLAEDTVSGEELNDLPVALAAFCEKKVAARLLKDGETKVLTKAVIRRLTRGAILPAEAA